MKPKVYGIPNCNSVKKAKDWLDAQGLQYTFYDFKKQGIAKELIEDWLTKIQINDLINRKGTTWRQLTESERASTANKLSAIALLVKKPSLIKRPVIEWGSQISLGFEPELYKKLLNS